MSPRVYPKLKLQEDIVSRFERKGLKSVSFERKIKEYEEYRLNVLTNEDWIYFEKRDGIPQPIRPSPDSINQFFPTYVATWIKSICRNGAIETQAVFFSTAQYNVLLSRIEDFIGQSIVDYTDGMFYYHS